MSERFTRREFTSAVAGAAALAGSLAGVANADEKKAPNLLFIMTDQQRHDALSLAGNSVLKTPNLDALGKQGAFFRTALTPCPVCAPARTSMFTGRCIEHTGVRTNDQAYWAKDTGICPHETFDGLLAARGYYVEYHGKFHSPIHLADCYREFRYTVNKAGRYKVEDGFHEYLDKTAPARAAKNGEQLDNYYKRPYRMDPIDTRFGLPPGHIPKDAKGRPIRLTQPDNHGCVDIPVAATKTAYQARACIAALRRAKASGKPFAVTCSLQFPHAPMILPKPYYGLYPRTEVPVPESIADKMDNSPYANANGRPRLPQYRDPEKIRYMISNYYGLVREIDDWVGRILDTLREIGAEENTLVVFASDHGEMLGAHGLREKNIFYEESVRVPLLLRFPGRIEAGGVVEAPVSTVDLFATVLDYLGAGKQASEGTSLRALIEGKDAKANERFAVSEWNYEPKGNWLRGPNFCVRTRDWKFMFCREPRKGIIDALYDLRKDPHEMNNLIGRNPDRQKHRAQAERMKGLLLEWLERVGHPHLETVKKKPAVFYEPA